MEYFTKHHHDIVQQFKDFKARTAKHLAYAEEQKEYIANLERHLALKTPVMEAEFALDETSAISFYDCLIPKLKEQRRFLLPKHLEMSIDDFRTKFKVIKMEQELQNAEAPMLREENK